MEDQDEFLMRNSEHTDVGVETNNRAQLEGKTQICILPIKRLTLTNTNTNTNTQP